MKKYLVCMSVGLLSLFFVSGAAAAGAIAFTNCPPGHSASVLVEFSGTQKATAVAQNTSTGVAYTVAAGSVKCPIPRLTCLALAGVLDPPWNVRILSVTITAPVPPVIIYTKCS